MATAPAFRNIQPEAALALNPPPRVIDVREPDEFVGELGHLPGALLVPIGTLPASAREWKKAEPILLVCRSGARSARAAEILAQSGFESVLNLEGGMIAVHAKKLHVER